MPLTAAEVSARCRARVLSLQPTELDVSSSTHLDAAVGLYHSVLPSISRRYLRKYMRRRGVTTLMLMLPLPSSKEAEEEKEMEKMMKKKLLLASDQFILASCSLVLIIYSLLVVRLFLYYT